MNTASITRRELALDVWELIVGILGGEKDPDHRRKPELEALKALSLACKAMVPICRKYLFSTLSLIEGAARSAHLRSVVSTDPQIILYIRNLEYVIHDPLNHDELEILSMLKDRSLVLKSIHLSSYIRWDEFPRSFEILLKQLICLPTVTHLYLSSMFDIPSSIFAGCTNVTSLTLRDVSFVQATESHDGVPSALVPSLDTLKAIRGFSDAIQFLTEPRDDRKIIDFSALKKLDLSICQKDRLAIWDLFEVTTAVDLIHLSTSGLDAFDGLGAALSTQAISTLEQFSASLTIDGNNYEALYELISELNEVEGENILTEISFDVSFHQTSWRFREPDKLKWRPIDALFSTFPMLKSVSLDTSWNNRSGRVGGDSFIIKR